jgi:hypothetical protein
VALMSGHEDAFIAIFMGDKPVVSKGGYIFQYFVPFAEADGAREAMGGAWKPDDPVTVGITRIKNATIIE